MIVCGIDVSKTWVDCSLSGSKKVFRVDNSPEGLSRLADTLQAHQTELVVVEATGGYEQLLCRILWGSSIPVAVINPRWIRDFAKSLGRRAKSDKIDATLLRRYGEQNKPEATEPIDEVVQELRFYLTRRSQLIDMMTMEKNHLKAPNVPSSLKKNIRDSIERLSHQIKKLDGEILSLVESKPDIKKKADALQEKTGVGPVLMMTLIADMPELGRVNRGSIAALAGVAPFTKESGIGKGAQHIAGGRARVRKALYMATLSAVRFDSHLKEFYLQLIRRGKEKKVALVACMRKFLIFLNSTIKKMNDE